MCNNETVKTTGNPMTIDEANITEEELKIGAFEFQRFWLRPLSRAGQIIPVRLRINKRFSGWKLKDELIQSLGLKVGDSINTEVTVLFTGDLIGYSDDMDLFADGEAADWLLDTVIKNNSPIGCVIDCFVELSYCEAPVGKNGKMINKASLILEKGIRCVEYDKSKESGQNDNTDMLSMILNDMLG